MRHISLLAFACLLSSCLGTWTSGQEIAGIAVTPHRFSDQMRWRRPPNPELSARVELFLLNRSEQPIQLTKTSNLLFDSKAPSDLLAENQWAWHDTPHSWLETTTEVPADSLCMLAWNGISKAWGTGTEHSLQIGNDSATMSFQLREPTAWLSAVTFLSVEEQGGLSDNPFPNQIVIHVKQTGDQPLAFQAVRLWLPRENGSPHVFSLAQELTDLMNFPEAGVSQDAEHHCLVVQTERLPRRNVVVEVQLIDKEKQIQSLWSTLKIKPERFDISGGWIAGEVNGRSSLTISKYLQLLSRMHINTGQIEEVGGYTDNPQLYQQYPIKRFNRMQDLNRYDNDEMLPSIHAVEFIGEPQYGGGTPIPPQKVWEMLAPYYSSRLPTSVTLSEERTWRYYAGLSDYPHYDAYRVVAPAADAWGSYDRWNGERIRWGAPLETIGDMTRSLRELSRPRPIAYWSQGAHDGWRSWLNPRRGSPTADELRSQAWHGIANRITSLYWFNLSLKSLAAYPDLIDPITRVNRELRLLEEILLEGDAHYFARVTTDNAPDWELNVIAAPKAALLVAHDVAYVPDPEKREFVFSKRFGEWSFPIPAWINQPAFVFRVDADGVHSVNSRIDDAGINILDEVHVVGIYVATNDPTLESKLVQRHRDLVNKEHGFEFDPANNAVDLEQLKSLLAEQQ